MKAVLLLSGLRACTACPASWALSESGACFRVTDVVATHWGCVEACGAIGGALACPASAAEASTAMEIASGGEWLGVYKDETGSWQCATGGAAQSFHRWAPSEPSVAVFDCAQMASTNLRKRGQWLSALCSNEGHCMCAYGAATTAAYNASQPTLEANAAVIAAEDADQVRVMIISAVAIGLGAWILLGVAVYFHVRRVNARHQAEAHASRSTEKPCAAVDAPVGNAANEPASEAADVESGDSALATAQMALSAAREAAARVRRNINSAALAAMVLTMMLFPITFAMMFNGLPFGPPMMVGTVIMGLSLAVSFDPMMPRKMRNELVSAAYNCTLSPAIWLSVGACFVLSPSVFGLCSTREPTCALTAWTLAAFFILDGGCGCFAMLVYVLPVVYVTREKPLPRIKEVLRQQKRVIAEDGTTHPCHLRSNPFYLLEGAGYYEMPVHTGIDRQCRAMQMYMLVQGPWLIGIAIAFDAWDIAPWIYTWGGFFQLGLASVFIVPVTSPPARRTVAAWLSRLGSAGEARQAAAVAGLLGDMPPAKALTLGKATFRGLPFSSLTAADFSSNTDTGLNTRTVRLALGKCDAFMSHRYAARSRKQSALPHSTSLCVVDARDSWHDDADAKWSELQTWSERFENKHGHSPMLWLDKVCGPIFFAIGGSHSCRVPSCRAGVHRPTSHRRLARVPARVPCRVREAPRARRTHVYREALVHRRGIHVYAYGWRAIAHRDHAIW